MSNGLRVKTVKKAPRGAKQAGEITRLRATGVPANARIVIAVFYEKGKSGGLAHYASSLPPSEVAGILASLADIAQDNADEAAKKEKEEEAKAEKEKAEAVSA
jgi:hypothetical protein